MNSPVSRAKALQGFMPAMQRPSCRNCARVVEAEPTGASNDCWRLRCTKGGFGVTAWSTCNQHEPKEATRAAKQPLVA